MSVKAKKKKQNATRTHTNTKINNRENHHRQIHAINALKIKTLPVIKRHIFHAPRLIHSFIEVTQTIHFFRNCFIIVFVLNSIYLIFFFRFLKYSIILLLFEFLCTQITIISSVGSYIAAARDNNNNNNKNSPAIPSTSAAAVVLVIPNSKQLRGGIVYIIHMCVCCCFFFTLSFCYLFIFNLCITCIILIVRSAIS